MFFATIFRERSKTIDRYFEMIDDAQRESQNEFDAAVLIQSHWRAFRVKQRVGILNDDALKIQSTWRDYKQRQMDAIETVGKETQARIDYFNEKAKIIQKVWRGYDSRRHLFDYYKQQEYLRKIAETNQRMKKELDNYYAKTSEYERRQQYEKEAKRQQEFALRNHHLVSTAAIPSIFQPPPFTQDAEAMPAIEQFIRDVNKSKIVIPSLRRQ